MLENTRRNPMFLIKKRVTKLFTYNITIIQCDADKSRIKIKCFISF